MATHYVAFKVYESTAFQQMVFATETDKDQFFEDPANVAEYDYSEEIEGAEDVEYDPDFIIPDIYS